MQADVRWVALRQLSRTLAGGVAQRCVARWRAQVDGPEATVRYLEETIGVLGERMGAIVQVGCGHRGGGVCDCCVRLEVASIRQMKWAAERINRGPHSIASPHGQYLPVC